MVPPTICKVLIVQIFGNANTINVCQSTIIEYFDTFKIDSWKTTWNFDIEESRQV